MINFVSAFCLGIATRLPLIILNFEGSNASESAMLIGVYGISRCATNILLMAFRCSKTVAVSLVLLSAVGHFLCLHPLHDNGEVTRYLYPAFAGCSEVIIYLQHNLISRNKQTGTPWKAKLRKLYSYVILASMVSFLGGGVLLHFAGNGLSTAKAIGGASCITLAATLAWLPEGVIVKKESISANIEPTEVTESSNISNLSEIQPRKQNTWIVYVLSLTNAWGAWAISTIFMAPTYYINELGSNIYIAGIILGLGEVVAFVAGYLYSSSYIVNLQLPTSSKASGLHLIRTEVLILATLSICCVAMGIPNLIVAAASQVAAQVLNNLNTLTVNDMVSTEVEKTGFQMSYERVQGFGQVGRRLVNGGVGILASVLFNYWGPAPFVLAGVATALWAPVILIVNHYY